MAFQTPSCSPYGWVEGRLLTLGPVPPSFCFSSLPTNLTRDNLFLYRERSCLLTKLESGGKFGTGRLLFLSPQQATLDGQGSAHPMPGGGGGSVSRDPLPTSPC